MGGSTSSDRTASHAALVVFVQGEFWRASDRRESSHRAAGALARCGAVALPGHALAPEARIGTIGAGVARAIGVAAGAVAGPVRVAGHPAGGQLVLRRVAGEGLLGLAGERVDRVASISGAR